MATKDILCPSCNAPSPLPGRAADWTTRCSVCNYPIWLPGQVVAGTYTIVKELGRGGMAIVHQAREDRSGRVVAIKSPLGAFAENTDVRSRFHREAILWMKLGSHPHIVHPFGVDELDSLPRILMEFCDGGSLADILDTRPHGLPETEAGEIALQICWAMEFSHQRGIVHRDIKASNILLSGGKVKVSDFGLAKPVIGLEGAPSGEMATPGRASLAADISVEGSVIGTPPYMPPEQWVGGQIVPASDVYSYGVVLYELFTGQRPFDPARHPAFRDKRLHPAFQANYYRILHCDHDPIDPAVLRPGLPEGIRTLLLRCLAKSPSDRPTSFLIIAEDLARFVPLPPQLRKPARAEITAEEKKDFAWSLIRLGNLARFRGDLGDAEGSYRKALGLALEINDKIITMIARKELAFMAIRRGDVTAREVQELDASLEQASGRRHDELGTPTLEKLVSLARNDREGDELFCELAEIQALVYLQMNRHAQAGDLLNESFEIRARRRMRLAEGVPQQLGAILRALAKHGYSRTPELCRKVLSLPEDFRRDAAQCLVECAHRSKEKAQFAEAIRHYREALTVLETLGDSAGAFVCLAGSARALLERCDFSQALDLGQKGLVLAERLGDPRGAAECKEIAGLASVELGQSEKGRSFLEETIRLRTLLGLPVESRVAGILYGLLLEQLQEHGTLPRGVRLPQDAAVLIGQHVFGPRLRREHHPQCADAERFYESGDLEAAGRLIEEILRERHNEDEALLLRAKIAISREEWREASKDLERAAATSAAVDYVLLLLGMCQMQLEEHEPALANFSHALALNPSSELALGWRGRICCFHTKNYEQAIRDYTRLLRIKPQSVEAYHNRGVARDSIGDCDAAIRDYDAAMKIGPISAALHYDKGLSCEHKGDLDVAVGEYTRAIELDQKYRKAFTHRADVLAQMGNTSRAVEDYTRAIALDAGLGWQYLNRGQIRKQMGDVRGASEDFAAAVRLDSSLASQVSRD